VKKYHQHHTTIYLVFKGGLVYVSTVGINREEIIKYVQDQWKKSKFIDGPQLDLYWN